MADAMWRTYVRRGKHADMFLRQLMLAVVFWGDSLGSDLSGSPTNPNHNHMSVASLPSCYCRD